MTMTYSRRKKMAAFEKYKNYEIPHIHNSNNKEQNIFEDALYFQGRRIFENLKKYFPKKTDKEIRKMMFFKDECMEEK